MLTPAEFDARIAAEVASHAVLAQAAGIKPNQAFDRQVPDHDRLETVMARLRWNRGRWARRATAPAVRPDS